MLFPSVRNSTKFTPEFGCLEIVYQWASSPSVIKEILALCASCRVVSGIRTVDEVIHVEPHRILLNSFSADFDGFLDRDPSRPSFFIEALEDDVANLVIIVAGLDHVGFERLLVGQLDYNQLAVLENKNLIQRRGDATSLVNPIATKQHIVFNLWIDYEKCGLIGFKEHTK